MSKAQNVIQYYVNCNKLKNVIRTGWKNWNVSKERLESVAEHIYGVQMLALAMYSEYHYDIDIQKVITMLALHELEEISIGDLTLFDISQEEKEKIGHEAVLKIVSCLNIKQNIMDLILEFDQRKTKEARFAYFCDKLEADIQAKLYDEDNCVDLDNQSENHILLDPTVDKYLSEGKSWSKMWLLFGQDRYHYDENFTEVSNYVLKNKINL